MTSFMEELIRCSEKAASLARACRREKDLFSLLVEEKPSSFKGPDFKTLGDVLIQETVRYDLSKIYPDLEDHILGEEGNVFTNQNGETIKVKVCPSQEETSKHLVKVLDGNSRAADLISEVVHSTPDIRHVEGLQNLPEDCFDTSSFGIWIDPIDGTNQYINGTDPPSDTRTGLPVVTVLIGVFDRFTGIPVAGVVNSPFHKFDGGWKGKISWGCESVKNGQRSTYSSVDPRAKDLTMKAVTNLMSVKPEINDYLRNQGFEVVTACGAGFKILMVILGQADVFVGTNSYRWDTCAGDAILNALGGGIIDLGTKKQLEYHKPNEVSNDTDRWLNAKGFVAYRNPKVLEKISLILESTI